MLSIMYWKGHGFVEFCQAYLSLRRISILFLRKHIHKLIFSCLQIKKHIKGGEGHEGGIFTVEAPLHASNVQALDPVTGYDWTPSS